MNNYTHIEFLSKIENVMFSRTIIVGFLVELNPNITFINELKTVISEAVTNAIVHGYAEKDTETVYIDISYDNEYVYLNIEDHGIGIKNIEEAKEPLFSTRLDEERAGLGFTIMEVFTDSMEIISKVNEGTILKFKKRYKKDE